MRISDHWTLKLTDTSSTRTTLWFKWHDLLMDVLWCTRLIWSSLSNWVLSCSVLLTISWNEITLSVTYFSQCKFATFFGHVVNNRMSVPFLLIRNWNAIFSCNLVHCYAKLLKPSESQIYNYFNLTGVSASFGCQTASIWRHKQNW